MKLFNTKGENTMKTKQVTKRSYIKAAVMVMSLLGLVAVATPQKALAAYTSGNATIHNAVTVVYTAGSVTKYVTERVNITVTTLAAAPTVTVPTGLSVYAGANASYTGGSAYIVRSNSNGNDTYTVSSLLENILTGSVSAATAVSNTPNVTLWGGYIVGVGGAASNIIKIPAGSEVGLTAGTTIEFLVGPTLRKYSVTTISAGTVAATTAGTTDTAPATTAETPTSLTLTPIGHAITADGASVGTQAGEYKTLDVFFTAGTPAAVGTDGQYNTTFTLTSTYKLSDGSTSATANVTGVTTTVYSPAVTIVKKSRNVTTSGTFATTGTTARPQEVLEYEITVSNAHGAATVSNVNISDAVPTYTATLAGPYSGSDVKFVTTVSGSPTTTYGNFSDNADVAYLNAGILHLTLGAGANDAKASLGGSIAHGDNVVITYQVTVQ
jgi:hypothetical protein